jgi:16S rRNA (guanine(966)-N(2))-methyltransferase RsmD
VRIIGGAWKRSMLPVTDVAGLRPTPDRVRETLFNWIEHLVADISTVRGLDLFAGSGALGLELASRGARHVTLIESNRQLADRLRQITSRLGANRVDVVAADAMTAAARWPPESFELIFVDPPYDSGLLEPALRTAARLVTRDGLIYVEHRAPLDDAPPAMFGLQQARTGRAGRVHFYLLRPASA